jgi:hypothetical protein
MNSPFLRSLQVALFTTFFIWISLFTVQVLNVNVHSQPVLSLEDHQEIFTSNVCRLLEYIQHCGYKVTLGEAYRTHEQALIYAKEGLGIKNSLHCERLAVDLNIFAPDGKRLTTAEESLRFGQYWESLHILNRWGGRWKRRPDADHYEMKDDR